VSDEAADQLRRRAAHLCEVGRYEEAIPLLASAISIEPSDPDLRCDLAVALLHAGRMNEADDEALEAIVTAPDYERVHRVYSIVLQRRRLLKQAVDEALESVRLDPNNSLSLQALGYAYLESRRYHEANEAAAKALTLAPDAVETHILMSAAASGIGDWSGVEVASREALRLDPTSSAAMNNLGLALKEQGRLAEAAQAYDRALQLEPDNETARRNLTRTMHARSHAIVWLDVTAAALAPISAPYLLVRWAIRWWRAHRMRARLSASARALYRSQSVMARIRRMQPVTFGLLGGLVALAVLFAPANIVAADLQSAEPQWGGYDVGLPSVVMLVVSAVVGVGCGLTRAWRKTR